jgi:hypothetical protein
MNKTVDEILAEHGAEEGELTYSLKASLQALVEEALDEVVGKDEPMPDLAKATHMTQALESKWRNTLRASQRSLIPQVISKMFGDTK